MPDPTPARPLPPLPVLQGLFHYNPLTGSITRLTATGPHKTAGRDAVVAVDRYPCVCVQKVYHRAAAVAWALYHETDPAPLHVIATPRHDLRLQALSLSPTPQRQKPGRAPGARRTKPKAERNIYRRHGAWEAWASINGRQQYLGRYETRHEAMAARVEVLGLYQEKVDGHS